MKPRRPWRWVIAAAVIVLAALALWHERAPPPSLGGEATASRPAPRPQEDRSSAALRERPSRERTPRP